MICERYDYFQYSDCENNDCDLNVIPLMHGDKYILPHENGTFEYSSSKPLNGEYLHFYKGYVQFRRRNGLFSVSRTNPSASIARDFHWTFWLKSSNSRFCFIYDYFLKESRQESECSDYHVPRNTTWLLGVEGNRFVWHHIYIEQGRAESGWSFEPPSFKAPESEACRFS